MEKIATATNSFEKFRKAGYVYADVRFFNVGVSDRW